MWVFYEKNKQALHDFALLFAAILICFLFFRYLSPIFLPFIIGWLMSLLFNPLADRLQKYHIPRGISAILGILLIFAAIGLLGFWSGTSLMDRIHQISENLPYYIDVVKLRLQEFWSQFDAFLAKLPLPCRMLFCSSRRTPAASCCRSYPRAAAVPSAVSGISSSPSSWH